MARLRQSELILLAEAQNWRCCYCGTIMLLNEPLSRDLLTCDHFVPMGDGGERRWDNEIAACHMCNNGRGDLDAMGYYRLVTEVGREKAAKMGSLARSRRDLHHTSRPARQWATLADIWPKSADGEPVGHAA